MVCIVRRRGTVVKKGTSLSAGGSGAMVFRLTELPTNTWFGALVEKASVRVWVYDRAKGAKRRCTVRSEGSWWKTLGMRRIRRSNREWSLAEWTPTNEKSDVQANTLAMVGGMKGVASDVSVFFCPCGRNGFADFAFYRSENPSIRLTLNENSEEALVGVGSVLFSDLVGSLAIFIRIDVCILKHSHEMDDFQIGARRENGYSGIVGHPP